MFDVERISQMLQDMQQENEGKSTAMPYPCHQPEWLQPSGGIGEQRFACLDFFAIIMVVDAFIKGADSFEWSAALLAPALL